MTESEDFLNWLCWMWAQDGERFYPPEETAVECVDAVRDEYEENYSGYMLTTKLAQAYQWEVGQHSRAYTEAVTRFRDCARRDFAPIERAAREQHDLRKKADDDYDKQIDWSWLKDNGN